MIELHTHTLSPRGVSVYMAIPSTTAWTWHRNHSALSSNCEYCSVCGHWPRWCPIQSLLVAMASTATTAGKELHNLAEEVVEILKGLAGREAFARVFAAVQKEVAEVRESRKRKKVLDVCTSILMRCEWSVVPCCSIHCITCPFYMQAVVNPEVSARQKIKRNLQKREQRKRKYRKYKGMSK